VNAIRGCGWQTTWPAFLFPMRIAVDHCLVSPELRVLRREVGRSVGSDHLPQLVEIALPQ
jgi:endonuclease/exonuclease/phosphatase family metal-dependent hydrolase